MTYVWNSSQSYGDYVRNESIANAAAERISMVISKRTRETIASVDALRSTQIVCAEGISRNIDLGVQQISTQLQETHESIAGGFENVSVDIKELRESIEVGLSNLAGLSGRMNDTLKELLQTVKMPAQTAAFEQFDIARGYLEKGLYPESLRAIERAITSYEGDWRCHRMKGILLLGRVGSDPTLIDLAGAEQSFGLSARYAQADSLPQEAAYGWLAAGWAAYCRGAFDNAAKWTEMALEANPTVEGWYQCGKISMAAGKAEKGLACLARAIDENRVCLLRAAADGDFQRDRAAFIKFVGDYQRRIFDREAGPLSRILRDHSDFASLLQIKRPDVARLLQRGISTPVYDMLLSFQRPEIAHVLKSTDDLGKLLTQLATLKRDYEVSLGVSPETPARVVPVMPKPPEPIDDVLRELQANATNGWVVLAVLLFPFIVGFGTWRSSSRSLLAALGAVVVVLVTFVVEFAVVGSMPSKKQREANAKVQHLKQAHATEMAAHAKEMAAYEKAKSEYESSMQQVGLRVASLAKQIDVRRSQIVALLSATSN